MEEIEGQERGFWDCLEECYSRFEVIRFDIIKCVFERFGIDVCIPLDMRTLD